MFGQISTNGNVYIDEMLTYVSDPCYAVVLLVAYTTENVCNKLVDENLNNGFKKNIYL